MRKQIVEKMEARMEIATTEAADLAAKQFMAELQPWIEREKAEHIKRIVAIAKRGFERIEKVWDENQASSPKEESLAAATLDKHDAIIRRNLGMNETSAGSCSLNVAVLTGARTIIEAQQTIDSTGAVTLEKTISQDQSSLKVSLLRWWRFAVAYGAKRIFSSKDRWGCRCPVCPVATKGTIGARFGPRHLTNSWQIGRHFMRLDARTCAIGLVEHFCQFPLVKSLFRGCR